MTSAWPKAGHGDGARQPGRGPRGRSARSRVPARLAVRDLEIRSGHGGPPVVSGVSFTIQPGQVLGLVGESGSGKTTVALALLGHTRRGLAVSRGEVWLDAVDLLRQRPAALRRIRGARVSYVPQDPAAALNPALRIGSQLREALRVHAVPAGEAQARIGEVLREARLERPWTCCGGTRISCPAASSSVSGWPWPSPAGPRSSCSTSPPPAWTSPRSGMSSTPCAACAAITR